MYDRHTFLMGCFFSAQHLTSFEILSQMKVTSHSLLNSIKRSLTIFVCAMVLEGYLSFNQILGVSMVIVGGYSYLVNSSQDLSYEDKIKHIKILFVTMIVFVPSITFLQPLSAPGTRLNN